MSDNRLEVGGCFCCAETRYVELVADHVMPDGRTIQQYQDRETKQFWWVDPELLTTWEAD